MNQYEAILENGGEVLPNITPTTVAGTRVNKPKNWYGGNSIRAISANPADNTEASLSYIVPIPTGFYYVGGDIKTGLVISDSLSDANKGTSNDLTLVGNQYVWIPATEDSFKREDGNKDKWVTTIEYDQNDFASKDELELDKVTDFTTGDKASNYGINQSVCIAIVNQISDEKTSVKKFGGFYIGRYETGKDGTSTVIKANVEPYTNIQWQTAYKLANGMVNSSVANSYLVSSYAWDTTIGYIMNNTTYINYATSRDGMNENWSDREVKDSSGTVIKPSGTVKRLKCRTYNT